jgi:hypothetical protein
MSSVQSIWNRSPSRCKLGRGWAKARVDGIAVAGEAVRINQPPGLVMAVRHHRPTAGRDVFEHARGDDQVALVPKLERGRGGTGDVGHDVHARLGSRVDIDQRDPFSRRGRRSRNRCGADHASETAARGAQVDDGRSWPQIQGLDLPADRDGLSREHLRPRFRSPPPTELSHRKAVLGLAKERVNRDRHR